MCQINIHISVFEKILNNTYHEKYRVKLCFIPSINNIFIEKFIKKLVKVNMIFMANLNNLENKLMKKIVDVSKLYHLFLLVLPNR